MVSETVTVINEQGFHMRPAGLFVKAMEPFQSTITVHYNGASFSGRSVMKLMAACMKKGAELELQCEGPDEAEMLQTAVSLIRSGLGE
jgi:phosphocarrier protein